MSGSGEGLVAMIPAQESDVSRLELYLDARTSRVGLVHEQTPGDNLRTNEG